jgi:hypothetical protein
LAICALGFPKVTQNARSPRLRRKEKQLEQRKLQNFGEPFDAAQTSLLQQAICDFPDLANLSEVPPPELESYEPNLAAKRLDENVSSFDLDRLNIHKKLSFCGLLCHYPFEPQTRVLLWQTGFTRTADGTILTLTLVVMTWIEGGFYRTHEYRSETTVNVVTEEQVDGTQ